MKKKVAKKSFCLLRAQVKLGKKQYGKENTIQSSSLTFI